MGAVGVGRREWRWGGAVAVGIAGWAVVSLAQEAEGRGAYLAYVTGCIGCHSAHDDAGNVADGALLAGGDHAIHVSSGGGVYPPNITPDPAAGIGGWTEGQVVAVLSQGVVPGGRVLSAAMPWRTQYRDMSEADKQAIARYILSVPVIAGRPGSRG